MLGLQLVPSMKFSSWKESAQWWWKITTWLCETRETSLEALFFSDMKIFRWITRASREIFLKNSNLEISMKESATSLKVRCAIYFGKTFLVGNYIQPWRRTSDKAVENLSVDHIFYRWATDSDRLISLIAGEWSIKRHQGVSMQPSRRFLKFRRNAPSLWISLGKQALLKPIAIFFRYIRLEKEAHKSFFNMRLDLQSYETILRNFTFDPLVKLITWNK